MDHPFEGTFEVAAEAGVIVVDGGGVALTITVEAAKKLAEELQATVIIALRQREAFEPTR